MSEAFNSVFVAARAKPIVIMLEEIRIYLVQRWESNRQKIAKYADIVLENIRKKLEKESQRTNHWIVRRAAEVNCEVRHTSLIEEKYFVNLSKKECSCRRWMLIGLPCCHALACMKDQHLLIDEFVPEYYKKECYADCYSFVIYPVNGASLWTKTNVDLQPPPIKRQLGRPNKKRNKEVGEQVRNETQLKRAKFGIKCGRCHKDGHNKATCKLPKPTQLPAAPTQEPVVTETQAPTQAPTTSPTQASSVTPEGSLPEQVAKKRKRLQKGPKQVLSQP